MPQLTDRVVQRRYRQTCRAWNGRRRRGQRGLASITLHFEQQHQVQVEQSETLALVAVMNLIADLAARAWR